MSLHPSFNFTPRRGCQLAKAFGVNCWEARKALESRRGAWALPQNANQRLSIGAGVGCPVSTSARSFNADALDPNNVPSFGDVLRAFHTEIRQLRNVHQTFLAWQNFYKRSEFFC